ncbi:MAG: NUDIX domain-containing protein [Oscillospiraceae bacterium]|nr:NUDIX domain-containing protein [Oscillospiraceae bacterium]
MSKMERENKDYSATEERIDAYLDMAKRYPHIFDNSEGQLEIILDRDLLLREQQKLYEKADEKGVPRSWYDIGVISEDAWVIFLRDLVRFNNGTYGGYTRLLNKNSTLEQTGKDVVVLVSVDHKLFVMKHFRHDDRANHWECPRGFGEMGLSAEENARKEVYEETGYKVLSIRQLNHKEESVSYFWAECSGQYESHDSAESIADAKLVTRQEFEEMIRDGLINDAFTIKAYTLARISC